MTQDIIRMAREAGFEGMTDHPALMRFANLVAAHKAEVALAEAYRCGHEAGAAAEREACSDIVDNADIPDCGWMFWLGISSAIRARGTT